MISAKSPYQEIVLPAVLNPASIAALNEQLSVCEAAAERFVVLKGDKGVFCNGLDLSWVAGNEGNAAIQEMQQFALFLKKLQCGNFISISYVNGSASGGGMGIVCASDYVISDETGSFALPEGLLGLIPGMILPSLLNRLNSQKIKKMVFSGKAYSAALALEMGIVDELVKDRSVSEAINEAIKTMSACKPGSVVDLKQMLYEKELGKDVLSAKGMALLKQRLDDPEIKQRIKDLSDFLGD
jgi:enoyl-CoA hydratase/carnithine racemase